MPQTPKNLRISKRRIAAEKKRVNEYFQKMGEFIFSYAQVELYMQLLLWHFAHVSHRTGKAIFSGFKTDQIIGLITRLTEKHPAHIKKDLNNIFTQLKH